MMNECGCCVAHRSSPPPTQFIPDTLPEAGTVALQEIIPAGCVETVHACIIIEATC